MTCPDDDTLAAIASLDDDQRAAILDHAAACPHCHAVVLELLEPPPDLAATVEISRSARPAIPGGDPTTIDRYRIEQRIGAGAMGVVFAAYDPELARPVAVKLLRSGGSPERMRREAQALAKLTHPNVVAVYDVGDHEGTAFVAMELVDGENLRAWLCGERTMEQRIDAIVQAARGVDAAHRRGIVHRDIKPDNIFVAKSGAVLVGDFGLASTRADVTAAPDRLTESSDLTATGSVVGTPAYMAPEQLDGEASAVSDQFAFCVTAWEALYGVRPFAGRSLDELARAVRKARPAEPEGRGVPRHVRAAIWRGLAADPRARHPAMADLITALAPPRRRWPYAAGAVGIGGAVALALAVRGGDASTDARCDDEPGPPAWTPVQRAISTGRLAHEKPALATAIAQIGDRYAAAWIALRRSTCAANARREVSDPVLAATTRCLERRARAFAWALDARNAARAFDTLGYLEVLEPVESCSTSTPSAPPGPELAALEIDLDKRSMLLEVAPESVTDLALTIARAEKLGDPGTVAEAHLLHANHLLMEGRDADAEIGRAIASAEQARDDRIRTRAFALRAVVAARAGRSADAVGHRDLASSALARSADAATSAAVERANVAIANARQDSALEVAAHRRIEATEIARFGEVSRSHAETYFALGAVMLRAADPAWRATIDRAIAMTAQLSDASSLVALENAAVQERSPARRIAIGEQAVAIARVSEPARLPEMLVTLAFDYDLTGDHERTLALLVEALPLLPATTPLAQRAEIAETVTAMAYESAAATDDKALRDKRLAQSLSSFDQLPPLARDGDNAQAIQGRALILAGRHAEAVPYLTRALDAAEHAEPPAPYKVAVRSFALAQALWELGTQRDRDRARALAAESAARFPEARAIFEENADAYGATLDRLAGHVARLEAWRRTHR